MYVPHPDLPAILSVLTPREREIVDYIVAGRPNKVIAIDLEISLRTVEAHRARIFAKLGVRNAMALACRLCGRGHSGVAPAAPTMSGCARAGSAPARYATSPDTVAVVIADRATELVKKGFWSK